MIEVKNLTKYYNFAERPAVKNVNFLAREGEVTVLPVSYTHLTLPTICSV